MSEDIIGEVLEEAICFGQYCYIDFPKKKIAIKKELRGKLIKAGYRLKKEVTR